MKKFAMVLMAAFLVSCKTVAPAQPNPDVYQSGIASYYGAELHGNRTANGERFNMNAMTAAHRSLPFGTMVLVENLNNGTSVIVRINDRGPFIKGRIIDLSKGAAHKINMVGSGTAKVRLKIIKKDSL